MPRHHLFELHDQSWFPEYFRNETTKALVSGWTCSLPFPGLLMKPAYIASGELILNTLRILNGKEKPLTASVIDICSGSGGPVIKMAHWMNNEIDQDERVDFILTDLYPCTPTIEEIIDEEYVSYVKESVDAANVPKQLASKAVLRTSFGSFHHLNDKIARSIFEDVVKTNSAIAIVEGTECSFFGVLRMIFIMPILFLFALFTIRPYSLQRFFFHLCVPIVPLVLLIDGTLSALRTYKSEDYWEILNSVDNAMQSHVWTYKKIPLIRFEETFLGKSDIGLFICDLLSSGITLNALVGIPRSKIKKL
jgi:hypothetical protein